MALFIRGSTSTSPTAGSTSKTEPTSQTYGQYIQINVVGGGRNISSTSVNVSTGQTSATDVGTVDKNSSVSTVNVVIDNSKEINNDDAKKQIILNSNNENSSPISINLTKDPNEPIKSSDTQFTTIKEGDEVKVVEKAVATIEGSAFRAADEIAQSLQESQKVDLYLALKSQESDVLEYNALDVPILTLRSTYNFYSIDEKNISSQEDPAKDPLLSGSLRDVPRYVELFWNIAKIDNPTKRTVLKTDQEKSIKDEYFHNFRGVASEANKRTKNSAEILNRNVSPIEKDDKSIRLADAHNLNLAFDSTSNSRLYKNNVNATITLQDNGDNIREQISKFLSRK